MTIMRFRNPFCSVVLTATLATILAAASAAPEVNAQDGEGQPVLPDLAPREVEIRGQLQIAFPSLRRQPLVGFNPPPRVAEIPLTRRPLVEDYAEAGSNFRRSELALPNRPGVAALTGEGPLTAEVELSAGRYASRHVHAIGTARLVSRQKVDVRFEYTGTDGDVIRRDPNEVRNQSDDVSGSIAYQKNGDAFSFGARIDGFASGYELYGLDTTGTSGRFSGNPDRTARSAGETLWIASAAGSTISYRLEGGLRQTRVESDLFATQTISDPAAERSERRGSLRGSLSFPVSNVAGFLEGRYESAGVDSDGLVGSDIRLGELSAGLRYQTPVLTFDGAAALLTIRFDGALGGRADGFKSATYVSPRFNLRLRTGDRVVFFASNAPRVNANSLSQLFTRSPFLVTEPRMQPSIMTISAESGISVFSGPIQIKAEAGLDRSPNWSFFQASTGSGPSSVAGGFIDVGYADGQIIRIGGEMSLSLPAQLQLSAAAFYHEAELTDLDVRIPYQPRISGRAGLSYPFASGRGLAQVTGRYIGSRFADLAESAELDPYIDLDLYARYNVSRSIGLVLRLNNIAPANNEVWSGYEESPLILSGGIRLLW